MELRDYLRVARLYWKGVVVVVAVVLAAAAAYTFTRPTIYAANANGFVTAGPTSDPALASVYDQLAESRAASYVEIARSRAVALEVIDLLGLSEGASTLVNRIDVERPVDTLLIEITARAEGPRQARDLADAWVSALASQVAEIEDPRGRNAEGTLRVEPIEPAALPEEPVSPRPPRDLGLGLALGLVLGAVYAAVRHVLDRRLRSPESIVERFDVSVVGVIPEAKVLEHPPHERATVALDGTGVGDHLGAGEAFRKLRSNLTYMDVDNPPRVIVVSSPQPGDGKSTVSINLAAAIAAGGEKVVLVDADLRRPSISESLGLVQGVGLTDVLIGTIEAEDALQESAEHANLSVLGSGRVPPNPSELLGSNAMQLLMEELRGERMVILDAPPLLAVTDAAVLSARADGVLIVVSSARTQDQELRTALDHVAGVNGRTLGVIMNRVTRGADDGYYASHYASPATNVDLPETTSADGGSDGTGQADGMAGDNGAQGRSERRPGADLH